MNAIEVSHLTKVFSQFKLDHIDLQLPKGYIMGLIGANGAGKTTLIKLLMGLYIADGGEISVFGFHPLKDGKAMRDKIGYVFDEPQYYNFRLKKIIKIISPFYSQWDEGIFKGYMERFDLKDTYKFKEMSRGMRLKFALAIALSHHARLLILDEPTSGLDPIFRLEFLDILQEVIEDEEITILFSSHITADVEKIADYVTYIKKGKIVFSEEKNRLQSKYLLVKGGEDKVPEEVRKIVIGSKVTSYYYEALIPFDHNLSRQWDEEEYPTLEEIMYYYEKGGDDRVPIDI